MHSSINADTLLRQLALSVARNNVGASRPIHEVLITEGLTQSEYDAIAENPQFQRYVEMYTSELTTSGFSFAAKSRVLAEDLLPTVYHMSKDPDVPAAVRMKAVENLVEWGELKPKQATLGGGGTGFSVVINIPGALGAAPESIVIEAQSPEKAPVLPVLAVSEPSESHISHVPVHFDEPDEYQYAGEDVL